MARAAMGVMLCAMLAMCGILPSVAYGAVGDGKGTVTITRSDGNNVTGYKAIKIFTADVENKGTDASPQCVATELSWASDAVRDAVCASIKSQDTNFTSTDPQAAADYLAAHITGSNYTTIVPSGSFAIQLANDLTQAMANTENVVTGITIPYDTATQLDEGYYLIINDAVEVSAPGSSATSPIFMLLAEDQSLSINEKVSVPTLTKTVVEDSAPSTITSHADAQVGQDLQFTLTGTMAQNVANYENYKYIFTDTLPKGMDVVTAGGSVATSATIATSDVEVKVDNTKTGGTKTVYTVTEGFTVPYAPKADPNPNGEKVLTISFANLKAAQGTAASETTPATIPIDKESVVTVTYNARLNQDAVVGLDGNTNSATLTYYTIPGLLSEGTSKAATATVYDFALKIAKVDKAEELDNSAATNTPLAGAKFTIQATTTDEGTNGRYLKNDGTFGATTLPDKTDTSYEDYVFTTAGTDGSVTVKGLDAGSSGSIYTITEVEAPSGYEIMKAPLVLTLKASKDTSTLLPTSVQTTLTGGNIDGVLSSDGTTYSKGTRAAYDAGTVTVTATNAKQEKLPLTGLPGITMVYVVGGTILVASLAVIIRRRVTQTD